MVKRPVYVNARSKGRTCMWRGWRSQDTTNVHLAQDFVFRLKTLMVAERYLSAPSAWESPCVPHSREAMAAAAMATDFIPILMAEYPDPGEEVEGAVLVQFTCKSLAVGQALLAVGGYIVKGVLKG